MDRTTGFEDESKEASSMNNADRFIGEDPESYRLIAECDGGLIWWVHGVNRYLVAIDDSLVDHVQSRSDVVIVSNELWTDSLVHAMILIGGHVAEVGPKGDSCIGLRDPQLCLDLRF